MVQYIIPSDSIERMAVLRLEDVKILRVDRQFLKETDSDLTLLAIVLLNC